MGFGLRMNGEPKSEIAEKVSRAAEILKLQDYLRRKPAALSGGQRQRVAIGRAIVRGPEVFLFDEPLSNLDAELRVEMRVEIARLHREIGATMIYVTHDQVEAMTLADKIVVLRGGIIEQVGAPLELYQNPANRFVAGFIGSPAMNFLAGEMTEAGVSVPALDKTLPAAFDRSNVGREVVVGVRPQDLKLENSGKLKVDLTEHLGGVAYSYLDAPTGERIVVELRKDEPQASGVVGLDVNSADLLFFDSETQQRLRSSAS